MKLRSPFAAISGYQTRRSSPETSVGNRSQNRPAEPEKDPVRVRAEIRHCFADVTRAREALRFEAAVSLEQGLPELAAWAEGQRAPESGDEAVAELRARGLVA